MPGPPGGFLITIASLCSLIYTAHCNSNYVLLVYANQISELPGVKITSHVQDQQVQTGRLSITGVSTDNSTTDCDVYIILNEIRPYQRVTPTGNNNTADDNHDYSAWNYTFTTEYATILEGNNRMVSKITCIEPSVINNENLTKFNSLNVTGIRVIDAATHANQEVQSPGLPTNTTYSELVQLKDPDSTNANLDNAVTNPEEDEAGVIDEVEDEKEDSDRDGSDDRNRNEEDEGDEDYVKEFIEELHERVSDQVREQLREQLGESSIDLPE